MSRNGQPRHNNSDDYQRVPRAVAAMPNDYPAGFETRAHSHERAQLIFASSGTMRVLTDDSIWLVPQGRALWMPALIRHNTVMTTDVNMRSLYLRADAARGMPQSCHVLPVSPLLRELIVRATELPVQYDEHGPAGHVMALILAELRGLQSLPLQLPMPRDPRLRTLCQALLDTPGDQRPLDAWARQLNASTRTLARRFHSETGLSFGAWRQQARMLEAMGRLGGGEAVTRVAFDLGYESVSAFSAMFRRAAGTTPSHYRRHPQAEQQSPSARGDLRGSATP